MISLQFFLFFLFLFGGSTDAEFADHFKNCHPNVSGFDACVREGLNAVRPFFKTGLAKYNVGPFDPFHVKEISIRRGARSVEFTLTLRNITESGWSASKTTKFFSDLSNYKVVYTQRFPEKALAGAYEFSGSFFGRRMHNKGKFTLNLYDLVQTTTVTRIPQSKVRVKVDVQSIGNLKLHITNLLQGRDFLESILDRIINGAWLPGFAITKPLVNELVSTAFTDIFGKAFQNFPFEEIIKDESIESIANE